MRWLKDLFRQKTDDQKLFDADDAKYLLNDPGFNSIMEELGDALEKGLLGAMTDHERNQAAIAVQVFHGIKRQLHRRIEDGRAIQFKKDNVVNFR